MKKIVLLFAITFVLFGCSSDDDEGVNSSSDKIIGTWGNYKDVYIPTNEVDLYDPYSEVATFEADGTASSDFSGTSVSGTWENLGEGIYKLTLFGITVNQKIEFVGSNEMIIYDSNTNNTSAFYYERIE